ncbi:MAG: FHA domain-containing protein [Acidobacteriota bacterium]
MVEVVLTYPTPEGSQEISVNGERLTFGRGSDVDQRFADDGLSRLHATVYRDGDRVWIVDENSSNGTFVNGQPAKGGGTPLNNGDAIKIGNHTTLKVRIAEKKVEKSAPVPAAAVRTGGSTSFNYVPLVVAGVTIFFLSISAIFIGYKVFGSKRPTIVRSESLDDNETRRSNDKEEDPTATPKKKDDEMPSTTGDNVPITDSPTGDNSKASSVMPAGKKYLDLSDSERRQYLGDRAMRMAQVIGNRSSDAIPPAAVDKIKAFADAYAKRVSVKPKGGCSFGDNLQATYERASKNAPFIIHAFNEKGTDPRIGLYLAMIESEHCVCLQSPTGPLGMFQFTFATAKLHFIPPEGVVKGASPSSPDDRCKPEPAARAAASYMKALTGRYGTGPASVPLAIGSYNSGEGGLSSNLQKALDSNSGLPRDFWTLIANGEILSKQFQSENFKYVPKFFAAAIIGENPQDFGLTLQPISSYSN